MRQYVGKKIMQKWAPERREQGLRQGTQQEKAERPCWGPTMEGPEMWGVLGS
jgi:hypothetical protein